MILDTSAVVAILNDEPKREHFEEVIATNDCRLSAMSYLEASIVLIHRRGEEALATLDTWIESAGIEIVPFTASHARLARNGYLRYGKGRHRANLNFGDCAAYALAIENGEDMLYEGEDFTLTDARKVEPKDTSA